MTNNTSTAVAVPSLLSRIRSALFGSDEGPFLDRHSSFLASCADPAALRRKADEYRDEQSAIERVRNRERPAGAYGLRTAEKWEDGVEAFNQLREFSIAIGQLVDKAARIEAERKWRDQRAADAGELKSALKGAAATDKAMTEAAAVAAGLDRQRLADYEAMVAKLARLADRRAAVTALMATDVDGGANRLLSDDAAELVTDDAARRAAELQTIDRAVTLGNIELDRLDHARGESKAAAWAAHRAMLAAKADHIKARMALRDHEGRELAEEWAALRLLQGLGGTTHYSILIDEKAVEERAAALRAEFAE
jgi:hypothetical protein